MCLVVVCVVMSYCASNLNPAASAYAIQISSTPPRELPANPQRV